MINNSVLYKEFLAERQEILCHKWIESEKAGYDIGFECALLDWTLKYRPAWRVKRYRKSALTGCARNGEHFKPGAMRPSSELPSPVRFAFLDTSERRFPGVAH